LCQLLQDSYFNDICEVRLEGREYHVVRVNRKNRQRAISLAGAIDLSTPKPHGADHSAGEQSRFRWPTLLGSEVPVSVPKETKVDVLVQNTFLHAVIPSARGSPKVRRAQSVPRQFGCVHVFAGVEERTIAAIEDFGGCLMAATPSPTLMASTPSPTAEFYA